MVDLATLKYYYNIYVYIYIMRVHIIYYLSRNIIYKYTCILYCIFAMSNIYKAGCHCSTIGAPWLNDYLSVYSSPWIVPECGLIGRNTCCLQMAYLSITYVILWI